MSYRVGDRRRSPEIRGAAAPVPWDRDCPRLSRNVPLQYAPPLHVSRYHTKFGWSRPNGMGIGGVPKKLVDSGARPLGMGLADPLEIHPFPTCVTCRNWSLKVKSYRGREDSKNVVDARVPPLETAAWTAPQKCNPRSRYLAKCGHVVLAKLYNDKQFNKNRPPCRLHG